MYFFVITLEYGGRFVTVNGDYPPDSPTSARQRYREIYEQVCAVSNFPSQGPKTLFYYIEKE